MKPCVLLVDDYEDSRFLYAHGLAQAGFRVEEAGDGQAGLDKARTVGPDIIVMDLSLPVVDGWEAIRQLKEDPKTRGIPVVALTAHALAGSEANPGFDRLLVKPCLPETLAVALHDLLGRAANVPSP